MFQVPEAPRCAVLMLCTPYTPVSSPRLPVPSPLLPVSAPLCEGLTSLPAPCRCTREATIVTPPAGEAASEAVHSAGQ